MGKIRVFGDFGIGKIDAGIDKVLTVEKGAVDVAADDVRTVDRMPSETETGRLQAKVTE